MAIRVFSDPDGREWQVWDVVPSRELEAGSRRHHYLPPEMAEGWLCFEAADEKRRLTPFPADWEQREDEYMHFLCQSAEPVASRSSTRLERGPSDHPQAASRLVPSADVA